MATVRDHDRFDQDADIAADDVTIVEVSPEDGWRMLDRQARKYLNLSGEEFVRQWESGEIEDPDRTDVLRVAFLIPLAADYRPGH